MNASNRGPSWVTPPRPVPRLLAALVLAATAMLAGAAPASATAYRYWSYWQGATGTWVAAQTGAGDHALVDRDVQGWRFALTTDSPTEPPDNAPDFAALCPDLATGNAPAGQLRVAVVIDSGYAAHAPEGQAPPADVVSCATVPEGATGNQALAAAGSVTDQGGLVCAINGYPQDECAAEVADDEADQAVAAAGSEQPNPATVGAAAAEEPSAAGAGSEDSGSAAGFVIGAFVLAALLGLAFAIPMARRRRRSSAD